MSECTSAIPTILGSAAQTKTLMDYSGSISPEGTNLWVHSRAKLNAIAQQLNERPSHGGNRIFERGAAADVDDLVVLILQMPKVSLLVLGTLLPKPLNDGTESLWPFELAASSPQIERSQMLAAQVRGQVGGGEDGTLVFLARGSARRIREGWTAMTAILPAIKRV